MSRGEAKGQIKNNTHKKKKKKKKEEMNRKERECLECTDRHLHPFS